MSTVINGSTGINKVQDGSIQPEDLAQKMTLMEAQTASGTYIDFTGIPSWAKRITVMLNGVSTNGTSNIIIQIGSGTPLTTGYSGSASSIDAGVSSSLNSTGFKISSTNSASAVFNGDFTLNNFSSNIWEGKGVIGGSDSAIVHVSGGKATLSGTLDRIRITTVNGTDTFDAGTINIMYEG